MRMKKRTAWLALGLILTLIVISGACADTAPVRVYEQDIDPSEIVTVPSTAKSRTRGGQLYDKWWVAAEDASEPTADHPLWSTQSSNTRSGSDTWRCKECHGWDYQGAAGAYGSGSHSTGFPGVLNAGSTKSPAELVAILKGGNNPSHDFSTVLSPTDLGDLANFLSKGLLDEKPLIDYSTRQVISPDLSSGQGRYASSCASCHGDDGLTIDFGDGEGIGALANDNPWEVLHKIRFGHPGSPMPATYPFGWSITALTDTLGHAQTLPE